MENTQDNDFNTDEINAFFYTNEKQIKKMDDKFILSKITEKYPDLVQSNTENILKQIIIVIANDTRLIKEIENKYDIDPLELFKTIYRNYEYIFNKCFITKVQKTLKNKRYARKATDRKQSKSKG